MIELGLHPFGAERKKRAFRAHDYETLGKLRERWNTHGVDKGYIDTMRAQTKTLFELMRDEREDKIHGDRHWNPPPKDDQDGPSQQDLDQKD